VVTHNLIEKAAHHLVRWTVFDALLTNSHVVDSREIIIPTESGYNLVKVTPTTRAETLMALCADVENRVLAAKLDVFDWSSEDFDFDDEFEELLRSHRVELLKEALSNLPAKVEERLRELVRESWEEEGYEKPADIVLAARILQVSPWQPHSIEKLVWGVVGGAARAVDAENFYLRKEQEYWRISRTKMEEGWVKYGYFDEDDDNGGDWVRFEPVGDFKVKV
jgi:hypothetical protein